MMSRGTVTTRHLPATANLRLSDPAATPPRVAGPTPNPSISSPSVPSPATLSSSTPDPAIPAPAKAWDDAALRVKIALLVLLAAVGGVLVGIMESRLQHRIWPLLLGIPLIAIPITRLGHRWACGPIERMVRLLLAGDTPQQPLVPRLPVDREDEVGQLARVVHRLGAEAAQGRQEARQLRRTLDDRVEKATHMATRNLKELAMRDPLTNLGNRRFLDEYLPELFESCQDSNADLVCIAIDIDHFKGLNDTLGHGAGDELLRVLGHLIQGLIRHEDFAVRLGGDEFLILMPCCTLTRVRQMADQLHALFRQHTRVVVRNAIKPDLSMGAASRLRDCAATPHELIKRADEYLYEAKRAGKGRMEGA